MAPAAFTHPRRSTGADEGPTDGGQAPLGHAGGMIGEIAGIVLIVIMIASLIFECRHYYTGRPGSLKTVYKGSWNPLVVIFSWPYHLYRFYLWVGKLFEKKKVPIDQRMLELDNQAAASVPRKPVEPVKTHERTDSAQQV